jgi:hypothetical protein
MARVRWRQEHDTQRLTPMPGDHLAFVRIPALAFGHECRQARGIADLHPSEVAQAAVALASG